MIIFLMMGWSSIIYGAFNMGEAAPILLFPTLPLTFWTFFHVSGYAFAQENRDQLDTVLDMFSYPARWVRSKDGLERIPNRVGVMMGTNGMHIAIKVDGKDVFYKANRAYTAKFQRKLVLLQDWREMQALVGHFKEIQS